MRLSRVSFVAALLMAAADAGSGGGADQDAKTARTERPITYGEPQPPLNEAQQRALEAGATDPADQPDPILATDQAALDERAAARERAAHEHQALLRGTARTVQTGPARTAGGVVLQEGAQGGAVAGQAGTAGQPTTTTRAVGTTLPAANQGATSVNPAGPGSPNAEPHAGPQGTSTQPVNADGSPADQQPNAALPGVANPEPRG
jgi:hypothetical protein